jgi:hypothetical protein
MLKVAIVINHKLAFVIGDILLLSFNADKAYGLIIVFQKVLLFFRRMFFRKDFL